MHLIDSLEGIIYVLCHGMSLVEAISIRLFGRAFAISNLSSICLCPAATAVPDIIAVVQSSEVLFVLGLLDGFRMIGKVYVGWVMDGELSRLYGEEPR